MPLVVAVYDTALKALGFEHTILEGKVRIPTEDLS